MPPPPGTYAHLSDRGIIVVSGPEAGKFLQGLLTNDVSRLGADTACHAGLLSPQGKILFEFIVARSGDSFLLDVAREAAPALVKRLTLYKLRADVTIRDRSEEFVVFATWNGVTPATPGGVSFPDPRAAELGHRHILLATERGAFEARLHADGGHWAEAGPTGYDACRIAAGVAEGGRDYDLGDTYPHEANFDRHGGVSFTKGCYVGQEIVARMAHKTVVRKRVVRVKGAAPLPETRPEIRANDVPIGRLGTVLGSGGLALLRLDRVAEFRANGVPLLAGGVTLDIAPGDEELVQAHAGQSHGAGP